MYHTLRNTGLEHLEMKKYIVQHNPLYPSPQSNQTFISEGNANAYIGQ